MDTTETSTELRSPDRLLVHAVIRGGGWFAADVTCQVVAAAVAVATPAALAAGVDAALGRGSGGGAVATLVVVLAVGAAATVAGELAQPYAATTSTQWLRLRLVDHLLRAGPTLVTRFGAGDLVTRLGTNTALTAVAGPTVLTSGVGAVTALGSVVALAVVDPVAALAFVVGAAVCATLTRHFVRDASEVSAAYQRQQTDVAGRLVDALAGARTVRSAGTLDREVARVLEPLPALAAAGRSTWMLQARLTWRLQLLTPVVELVVLAVAGYHLVSGVLSPGGLLAVMGYATLALRLFDQSAVLVALGSARAAARRVHEVLTGSPRPPSVGTAALPPGPGRLDVDGVRLAGFDPRTAAVELSLPTGRVTALVGSGASALAAVLGGLVAPETGRVRLDGAPVADLAPRALRDGIGYAFERPVLVGDTLRDAVALGGRATDVTRAARLAQADGFVARLPRGWATPLPDAPFSGGEVQRLGLARAFHRDSRVLVLDDAMSSLDTVTEAQVTAAVRTALAGRTRVVVARRAGTAGAADDVVWVDERLGVRGRGPHAALWRDPDYRAFFTPGPELTGNAGPDGSATR